MNLRARIVTAALVVLAATPATAQNTRSTPAAQTELGSSSERPWAKGVPADEQRTATGLFREGNGLLKESLFVQAAEKYREALAHWNHPGIHYNLALALLNLDQPVEVVAQLDEAMKYGYAPLDSDKFEHAGRYRALIEKQLARVEISCAKAGANVSMDGRALFTAPGRWEGMVRVGQHTFVATLTGYVTTQKAPTLASGPRVTIDLPLYTADDLTQYRHHWSVAMPWSILAAGIVLAGAGGIMHWQAGEAYKSYDRGVTACANAAMGGGCTKLSSSVEGKRSAGDALQVSAYAGYVVGGALAVTGAILAYVNRAKPYRINADHDLKATIVPAVGLRSGGLVASFHF